MIPARFSDRSEIEAIVDDAGSKRLGERCWPLENLFARGVTHDEIAKLGLRERAEDCHFRRVGKVAQLIDADYRRDWHRRSDLREDQRKRPEPDSHRLKCGSRKEPGQKIDMQPRDAVAECSRYPIAGHRTVPALQVATQFDGSQDQPIPVAPRGRAASRWAHRSIRPPGERSL